MSFTILHGVAKPARVKPGRSEVMYPLDSMNVGDMFHVPLNGTSASKVQRRLQSALSGFKKRHPEGTKKFSVRVFTLLDTEGVGVWRDQ